MTTLAAKAAEVAERGMNRTMSAFIDWTARHCVDVDESRGAKITLRRGEDVQDIGRAIGEGMRVWKDAGVDEDRYRSAQIRFPDGSFDNAWRWLASG